MENEKMDYNKLFNTNGKIPVDGDFFKNYGDVFTSKDGIIDGFKTVLGEQIIHVRQPARTPLYSLGIGAPLTEGDAWTESLIGDNPTYKYNPRATAEDALGHYGNTGSQKVFTTNFAGRKTRTADSDLELKRALINGNAGQINNILVDAMQKDYQNEIESEVGVCLVNSITSKITADLSTPEKIRELISNVAIDMKESNTKYSDMATGLEYADEVVAIMPRKLFRKLSNNESILPNAGALNIEADVVTLYGGMPTPLTAEQYAEKRTVTTFFYDQAITPPALGDGAPDIIVMDKKYFEVRPFLGEYKMTSDYNGAGDFRNYHLLFRGAMGIKPWRSAVRIYNETPVEGS